MSTRYVTGRIAKLTRRQNSLNGNPRWQVHLESGENYPTGTDSSIGYGIGNPEYAGRHGERAPLIKWRLDGGCIVAGEPVEDET